LVAPAGRGDWILCQVTSNPYHDPRANELENASFAMGSLRFISYARPGKLFTASLDLFSGQVGKLKTESFGRIIESVAAILRGGGSA